LEKTNRNDLCWCGSNEKYKQCHEEIDQILHSWQKKGFDIPSRSIIKTRTQIEGIKKSGQLTKMILDMLEERIIPGINTLQIDSWVFKYTIDHGGFPAPLNYRGFPRSVCTSINQVICHGIPDETIINEGDIINIDVTTILNGFYADASRMYYAGNVSPQADTLVKCAHECMNLGIKQVKPYTSLQNIGYVIEQYASTQGYSVVKDYGGHGIGLQFHEEPFVGHYADSCEKGYILAPGMVFTIEPMINAGSSECTLLADRWTTITKDGSLSAQWEHTILVTPEGFEILTA